METAEKSSPLQELKTQRRLFIFYLASVIIYIVNSTWGWWNVEEFSLNEKPLFTSWAYGGWAFLIGFGIQFILLIHKYKTEGKKALEQNWFLPLIKTALIASFTVMLVYTLIANFPKLTRVLDFVAWRLGVLVTVFTIGWPILWYGGELLIQEVREMVKEWIEDEVPMVVTLVGIAAGAVILGISIYYVRGFFEKPAQQNPSAITDTTAIPSRDTTKINTTMVPFTPDTTSLNH